MSDHIEHDGKRYIEISYLEGANTSAKRNRERAEAAESRLAMLTNATEAAVFRAETAERKLQQMRQFLTERDGALEFDGITQEWSAWWNDSQDRPCVCQAKTADAALDAAMEAQ